MSKAGEAIWLIPGVGRQGLEFGSSSTQVRDILGLPDRETRIPDFPSYPRGRCRWDYENFGVAWGSEIGVFAMECLSATSPIFLWDQRIDRLSPQQFLEMLSAQGASGQTFSRSPAGTTDVFAAEKGILATFTDRGLMNMQLSIPYVLPTVY